MATKTAIPEQIHRWASLPDAATYLGVSQKTLRRMIQDGTITGYRINSRLIRLDLNELDTVLSPIQSAVSM